MNYDDIKTLMLHQAVRSVKPVLQNIIDGYMDNQRKNFKGHAARMEKFISDHHNDINCTVVNTPNGISLSFTIKFATAEEPEYKTNLPVVQ
jgi:hypothetical protein